MLWFIDFDDTLAVGPFTWAFEHVIPQVVREHNLPYDEAQFNRAALEAQRQVDDSVGDDSMIEGFFKAVGWPSMLKGQFGRHLQWLQQTLFDDTRPFWIRLSGRRDCLSPHQQQADKPWRSCSGIDRCYTLLTRSVRRSASPSNPGTCCNTFS
jgi:hypothetical protein